MLSSAPAVRVEEKQTAKNARTAKRLRLSEGELIVLFAVLCALTCPELFLSGAVLRYDMT